MTKEEIENEKPEKIPVEFLYKKLLKDNKELQSRIKALEKDNDSLEDELRELMSLDSGELRELKIRKKKEEDRKELLKKLEDLYKERKLLKEKILEYQIKAQLKK